MTKTWVRHALRWGVYLLASVSFVLATVLSATRWWLPQVAQHKPEIEALVSKLVKQPVRIEDIDAGMDAFTPRITLKNLHILSADGARALVTLQRAWIDIDLPASLWNAQVTPSTLGVDRVRLGLARLRDGRLRVLGIDGDNNETDTRKIIEWVLNQKFLELRHSDIVWRDYMHDEDDWYFNDVNVRLHSVEGRHDIFGNTSLPLEIGYRAQFAAHIDGDPTVSDKWRAEMFVAATGLRAGRWMRDRGAGGLVLREGRADTHLWSTWNNGQLTQASGDFHTYNLILGNSEDTLAQSLDSADGQLAVARTASGWRAVIDQLRIAQDQTVWLPAQIRVGVDDSADTHSVYGSVSALRAEHAALLAALPNALSDASRRVLTELRPRGTLENNRFYFERNGEQSHFIVQGQIKEFAVNPHEKLPGITGGAARYVITPNQGRIDVDTQDVSLVFPKVFSEPVNLLRLTASAQWQRDETGLHIWTSTVNTHNADGALYGNVLLDFPADEKSPPWINLAARFNHVTAARIGRYLPVRLLSKEVVEWIRQAMVGGTFPSGDVVYYGALNGFPYDKSDGRFELRAQLKDVILNYAHGWPLIAGINGELVYDGRQLRVNAQEAAAFKNKITGAMVEIPSFGARQVWLNVRGHVEGETSGKLRYLHESPLEEIFAKGLAPFGARGLSDLDLALAIPLSGNAAIQVKGGLQLHDNRITAAEYDLDFARADGTLFFTENSITGRQLRAYMNDRIPLSIAADTDAGLGYRAIHISAESTLTQTDLRELFGLHLNKAHWANLASGVTPVKATVNIPVERHSDFPLTLEFNSTLNGMAVRLPLPAAKPATGERNLDVMLELTGAERLLSIDYGDLHTLLQFRAAAGGLQVQRGAISSQSDPKLPNENALHFTGRTNYLSWPEWDAALFPPAPATPLVGESSGPRVGLYFNVRIDALDAYGNRFHNVSLQASEAAQGYSLHINSDQAAGNLFIPEFIATTPLVIDMDRLNWTTGERGESTGRLDPRELPSMRISAKSFKVDNIAFGSMELNAERIDQGLRLNKLELQNPHTQINATGTWLNQYNRQTSRFNIETKTKDVGKMLEGFNYSGGIRGGTGQFTIAAGWLGSPFDFSLEKLDGTFKLLMEDGRILDIEPGAARMFGLLSLQALPRRFTLDFSDMFAKGMTFDHIAGEFTVASGDAYTKNLIMDGPSALIKLAGRVGLTRRDYDQDITVVPHVGESIPIIGTALTGPTIGAVLLVLQKLLEKQIQAVSTVHYRITGPWSNPVIGKINKDQVRSSVQTPAPANP